jgi:crotonobetaine/carnitine-CoA ligase
MNITRPSLVDMLETVTDRDGSKVALYFDDVPITYEQLLRRSRSTANVLHELGVGPGDTVATLTLNCPEQIYLVFAAAYLGAMEVPLNAAYRGSFLTHIARTAKCKVVLADADRAPLLAEVAGELPDLQHVLVEGGFDSGSAFKNEALPMSTLSAAEATPPTWHEASWTDPVSIQFTSGTTGPSKGAVLTQNYLLNWAEQFSSCWYESPDDRFLTTTPLFHMAAKGNGVLGALYRGATCVVDSRFSVSRFWDRVRQYNVVSTTLVGAMTMMLWNQPASDSDRDVPMRKLIAVPVPAELLRAMEARWNCRILGFYGLSEAAPLTISGLTEPLAPGTSGRVNSALFDVRVVDDSDEPVAARAVGEIVCRPKRPHVMFEEYFGNAHATVTAFRNLWFHTGDLATVTPEGDFIFVDRKKDYLRRRGENISSFEVEVAVALHEAVEEVAAVAVPSELGEDEVKICVVLRPGRQVLPEELFEHCYNNMPYYAVPRFIEFYQSLPKTPSQRVEKYRLREPGVSSAVWDSVHAGFKVSRDGITRPGDR